VVDRDRVEKLVRSGQLQRDGSSIRLTARGRLLLDYILGEVAAVGEPRALAVG
jgi:coproporphyrinogen III oxidase-like Fe-S oxidoreductase